MEAREIAPGDVPITAAALSGPVPISYGRLIAAGLVGNILEWYDFSIYGYFAVTIGRHFFPAHSLTTSNDRSVRRIRRGFGAAMSGVLPSRFRHEMTPLPGIGSQ